MTPPQPQDPPGTTACGIHPARCPLCGRANECQQASCDAYKGLCWCERVTFPDELLNRIPEEARNRACVCRACVVDALKARPDPLPTPDEYYWEPGTGRMVLTAKYLLRRGYCCGHGCRHCPWPREPGARSGATSTALIVGALLWALDAGGTSTQAATWREDFAQDPVARGWRASGETNRFTWNAPEGRMEITWDTACPHSFFAHPLPQPVSETDDFSLAFDLHLTTAQGGAHTGRPGAMQVAVGFLNLPRALATRYLRGAGKAFETLEFNWFPEGFIPGYGTVEPTLSTITYDANGKVLADFAFPVTLEPGKTHRVRVRHDANPRQILAEVEVEGQVLATTRITIPTGFGGFRLDALAMLVWDERTSFSDSLSATGWVDNIEVVVPDAPVGTITLLPSQREVEVLGVSGWNYRLEASLDLRDWQTVDGPRPGTGQTLRLADTRKAQFPQQFYRVQAGR
ncbi:MAG: cysteine-rich CWC family protein [Limisphaerales bacterium]